jgi:hypothetical protein
MRGATRLIEAFHVPALLVWRAVSALGTQETRSQARVASGLGGAR